MASQKPQESFIYFAYLAPFGLVRIGCSQDPERQIKEGASFLPFVSCHLLGQIPGDSAKQKRLHEKYKSYQHNEEWFFVCGHLKQWLLNKFGQFPEVRDAGEAQRAYWAKRKSGGLT